MMGLVNSNSVQAFAHTRSRFKSFTVLPPLRYREHSLPQVIPLLTAIPKQAGLRVPQKAFRGVI